MGSLSSSPRISPFSGEARQKGVTPAGCTGVGLAGRLVVGLCPFVHSVGNQVPE